MTFSKKTLFLSLLGFDLLTNILVFTHINFFYTTTLLSFCTSLILPGLLISLILRLSKISFWENLLIIVGLSIAFLEFGGLFLNILLPLIGIQDPLAPQNIIWGFDIYTLLLFLGAWQRTTQFTIQIPGQSHPIVGAAPVKNTIPSQFVKPNPLVHGNDYTLENVDTVTSIQIPHLKRSKIENFLYVLPIFFPILAALGAIRLNNGGSDILTLILLGAIGVYCLLLLLFRTKIADALYPYGIFFIGMALLFTTSLRGWYITGHDVEREFYVFQLTNSHHVWNMAFYQDAYNACLSITILPTVLTHLLAIQDIYIYKVIFQILFATAPVLVFFIVKNYATPILAFFSAFFFVSFPTFFNDMAMLNRQEIAFIFFGLLLYVILFSNLTVGRRRILFIIFALGIIISHYSTNFVVLVLVAVLYILTLIMSRPFIKNTFAFLLSKSPIKIKNTFPNKAFLSLPLVLIIFFMTYTWNTLYTHSSDHASSVITEVIGGLFVQSKADSRSGDLTYSLFSPPPKQDPKQQLQTYINARRQLEDTGKASDSQLYSKSITDKYPSYPVPQDKLAPTALGDLLTTLHIPVFNLQAELRSLSASFMQIFVFVGLIALFFLKNKKTFDLQYLLLCFGALFLLALITLLPALSVDYGVLRMFQQLLFVLSLPIVLGLNAVFFFIKEQKRVIFTGIIAIFFFLNLTGFLAHLTGDYYPQLPLDNSGLYYNAYYVHKSDVVATAWLSKNKVNYVPVEADLEGITKLLTYGGVNGLNEDFPPLVRKNAYVYLEISSSTIVSFDSFILIYDSDKTFLDDNKNLIYNNGHNTIYK